MNVLDFNAQKERGEKITMLTCYDFSSAQLLDKTNTDCLLVGDSAAMVMHGYPSTTHATMEMMISHTQAVSKGAPSKFIIADLPFLSYRQGLNHTMHNVQALIQAGAHAVKLEGAGDNCPTIEHIVASGVPVMGHLGLTPQAIHSLGGHKVQGQCHESATFIKQQAKNLEQAGCFAIVLECIPCLLAKEITQSLQVPTIGIGAGPDTGGQVLVWQDFLGLQTSLKPKFLKHFATLDKDILAATEQYVSDVKSALYPSIEHSY